MAGHEALINAQERLSIRLFRSVKNPIPSGDCKGVF